jgi:succinoglycan biosynthesis protein ExoW
MIGVVIPYFQRTPGLLARAMTSVANQCRRDLRIYVVDDGSPRPANIELASLPAGFPHSITVLNQENGGPGMARNRALDALDDDVETVAFLDSDDAWRSGRLARACLALAAGADFYFADHQREGEADTRFTQCRYEPDGAVLAQEQGIFWCSPGTVSRSIVKRSPVGTSTVVVRRAALGGSRFNDVLRSAGEDTLLWLELLGKRPRVACGLVSEVAYGKGLNVFGHGAWGDARSLRTTLDEMRSQHFLRTRFSLPPDLQAESLAQTRRLDLSFCANVLACARRLRLDAVPVALDYVGRRPLSLLRIPEALAQALRERGAP